MTTYSRKQSPATESSLTPEMRSTLSQAAADISLQRRRRARMNILNTQLSKLLRSIAKIIFIDLGTSPEQTAIPSERLVVTPLECSETEESSTFWVSYLNSSQDNLPTIEVKDNPITLNEHGELKFDADVVRSFKPNENATDTVNYFWKLLVRAGDKAKIPLTRS